jgi:hypothetical protein
MKDGTSQNLYYFETLEFIAATTVGEGLALRQNLNFNFNTRMNDILATLKAEIITKAIENEPEKFNVISQYERLLKLLPETSVETKNVANKKITELFSNIQNELGYNAETFFNIYFYLNQANQKELYENGLAYDFYNKNGFKDNFTSVNFEQWFANSKVVNGEEPMVVYHGTGANEFTKFNFDNFPIAYFAENEEYSDWFQKARGGDGVMFQCYLRVQNPMDLRLFGVNLVKYDEFVGYILLKYGYELPLNKMLKALSDAEGGLWAWRYLRGGVEWLKMIKNDGAFDGIKYYENNPADIKGGVESVTPAWAVFSPEQIKSSRGNLTFSYESKDIRFEDGGFIKK